MFRRNRNEKLTPYVVGALSLVATGLMAGCNSEDTSIMEAQDFRAFAAAESAEFYDADGTGSGQGCPTYQDGDIVFTTVRHVIDALDEAHIFVPQGIGLNQLFLKEGFDGRPLNEGFQLDGAQILFEFEDGRKVPDGIVEFRIADRGDTFAKDFEANLGVLSGVPLYEHDELRPGAYIAVPELDGDFGIFRIRDVEENLIYIEQTVMNKGAAKIQPGRSGSCVALVQVDENGKPGLNFYRNEEERPYIIGHVAAEVRKYDAEGNYEDLIAIIRSPQE